MKNCKSKLQTGFSLIEMLVALGVFSLVVFLIIGSFLSLRSVQKDAQSAQEILNELRFSLDVIAKEITSGSAFPDKCENGCGNIVFASKVRPDVPLRTIEYKLAGGVIMKGDQKTYGECASLPLNSGCYQPITSDKLRIDLLEFFINYEKNI